MMKDEAEKQNRQEAASPTWVAARLMSELISRSSPEDFGRHLAEQTRELTGARTVILLSHQEGPTACTALHVCPERRAALFAPAELALFCPHTTPEAIPLEVVDMLPDHPATSLLQTKGIQSILRVPLLSGGALKGSLLLFDLPEPERMRDVQDTLDFLIPFFGVAMENLYAHERIRQQNEQLERAVNDRTTELEGINRHLKEARLAALNMMEDAIRDKERLTDTARFPAENANPVLRASKNGNLLYRNAACDEMEPSLGGAREGDMLSETWRTLFHEALSANESVETEIAVGSKYFTISLVPFVTREYINVYAKDITQRKRAEEDVEEARRQFELLVANLPGMAYRCRHDKDRTMVFMSEGTLPLTGYRPEDFMEEAAMSMADVICEEDRDDVWETIQTAVSKKTAFELEYRINTRDGQPKWVWERGDATFSNTGELQFLEGFITDISDRKMAEAEVLAARTQLQYIIDHTHDAIFQIDRIGNFIYVNSSAETMSGYTEDELLTMNMITLVAPEHQAPMGARLERRLAGNQEEGSFSFEITRKEGRRIWVELNTIPLLNEAGELRGVQGVARDITERKQMQDAIEKRIVALTQPLDDTEDIDFDSLFNQEEIQRIQNEFASATGVASVIIRPDGTPITKPSNFTDLCKLVRKTEKGCANCRASDAALGRYCPDGSIIHPCLSCGLLDAGTNIKVGTKHIGSWLIGQVRDGSQTEEQMRDYAREIGTDETAFVEAFRKVPVMSRTRFEKIVQALYTLASQLSTTAYQNVQQARFITEQKQTQQALHESQEHLEKMWAAMNVGIVLVDAETRQILRANPAILKMSGFCPEELVGKTFQSLLCPDDERHRPVDNLDQYIERSERKLIHADGHLVEVEKSVTPITLEGRFVYLETLIDISERKEADEEMRRLNTAIEQSPETVVITDLEGHIQYANPAFEQVSGYTREEVAGKKPDILNSGEHDAAFYADLWKTIAAGRIWEGRFINRRKNGTLYTEEATITPVKDANGTIINYVAVKRDITSELIREDELRQAQKMDAVGQLAGGIAHDFNNILQGIMGFCEMLQMDLDTASSEYDSAQEIHKAAKRAKQLTRQLLTFSRKQPSRFESADLNHTILDSEALIDVLLGEKYEFNLDLQEELPSIFADPGQLSQIIMNMAVNARDAMPGGGRLTIATDSGIFQPEDAALIAEGREGNFVCLSVTDTGTGMDEKTKTHLFEPFFTTKEVGTGTGLGLSVVYGIVKQCKGWINVYSEIDMGSCFKIYFPENDPAPETPEEATHPLHEHRRATILLVEDDPAVATMAAEILQFGGHDPTLAISAEDALEKFRKLDGKIDLLISDMVLPGMRGDELADALRKINPDLPVLLVSGYRDQKARWKHLAHRDYLFMNKPFSTTDFISMVEQLV